jgi:hypothetical protein
MPPPPSQNHKRGKQSATPKQVKVKQNILTILYSIYNTNNLGKTTKTASE